MTYKKYDNETIEKAKQLFEDGQTKTEISRMMNIPRCTLSNWIHPSHPKKN